MSQKYVKWRELDNAAKIFPPNSNKYDTKVFRFSCTLTEDVDKDILQQALNKTIKKFPLYKSVIRKGLFWYYLEDSDLKAVVREESKSPCAPIYDENYKALLFNVTYWKRRINLEVHHALTDGVGATQFLKTLICRYLRLKHSDELAGRNIRIEQDASNTQKEQDGFKKYSGDKKNAYAKERIRHAYQFKDEHIGKDFLRVITGRMSVKQVLHAAHKYNTTMTIYLTAVFIRSIGKQMSEREKQSPIVVSIPVNLRTHFESASARNFFSVILAKYYYTDDTTLENIINYLKEFFAEELKKEKLKGRMDYLVSMEKNYLTRAVPLIFKKPALKLAHYYNNKEVTTSFSNMGKVVMPEELDKFIEAFDVCVSTRKVQICACSYKDILSINFTTPFKSAEVEKYFFRALVKEGIEVTLQTNLMDEIIDN